MNKKLLFSLLMALSVAHIHAATVRIRNKTQAGTPAVYAQINNESVSKGGGVTGISRFSRPHYKKIDPGQSTFFNSGLGSKITKVNFTQVTGTRQIKLPKKDIPAVVNDLAKKIGKVYAYYYDDPHLRQRYLIYKNEITGEERKFPQDPGTYQEYNQEVTIQVPTVRNFTYNLGNKSIGAWTTEARIDYIGWGDAKRV